MDKDGKFLVTLSETLRDKVKHEAAKRRMSMNAFVVNAVNQYLGQSEMHLVGMATVVRTTDENVYAKFISGIMRSDLELHLYRKGVYIVDLSGTQFFTHSGGKGKDVLTLNDCLSAWFSFKKIYNGIEPGDVVKCLFNEVK